MARPTKLTDEVRAEIENALRAGAYAEQAAIHAGVSPSSYYSWLARGRQEAKRLEQADDALEALPKNAAKRRRSAAARECAPVPSEAPYLEFLDAIARTSADAEVYATGIVRKHMKDDWRAAIAFLERRYPERWRKITGLEVGGSETGRPVEIVTGDAPDPGDPAARETAHDALRRLAGREGRRQPHRRRPAARRK